MSYCVNFSFDGFCFFSFLFFLFLFINKWFSGFLNFCVRKLFFGKFFLSRFNCGRLIVAWAVEYAQ